MSHWHRTATAVPALTATATIARHAPATATIARHAPAIPPSSTTEGIYPPFELAVVPFSVQKGIIIQESHAPHSVRFATLVRLASVPPIATLEVGPFYVEHGSAVAGSGHHLLLLLPPLLWRLWTLRWVLLLTVLLQMMMDMAMMAMMAVPAGHATAAARVHNLVAMRRVMLLLHGTAMTVHLRTRRRATRTPRMLRRTGYYPRATTAAHRGRRTAIPGILRRTARQPVAPPSSPHPAIAEMHGPLTVRKSAPARHLPGVPALVAVGVRERHARDAMGSGAVAPRIFLEAGMVTPGTAGGAGSVRDFGGGRSGGLDVAAAVAVPTFPPFAFTAFAYGELRYGGQLLRRGYGSLLRAAATSSPFDIVGRSSSPAAQSPGTAGVALSAHPEHFLDATIGTIDKKDLPPSQHLLFSQSYVGVLGTSSLVVVGAGFRHGIVRRRRVIGGGLVGRHFRFGGGFRFGVADVGLLVVFASAVVGRAHFSTTLFLLVRYSRQP